MSDVKPLEAELNQMILNGQALEAFEKFYAEDLVMQENNDPPRIGKTVNREFEEQFFGSIREFHGATLGDVAVENDVSFSEWTFDVTFKDGNRIANPQATCANGAMEKSFTNGFITFELLSRADEPDHHETRQADFIGAKNDSNQKVRGTRRCRPRLAENSPHLFIRGLSRSRLHGFS